MDSRSRARLAGAESTDIKSAEGGRLDSHTGQVGQSVDLKYKCP